MAVVVGDELAGGYSAFHHAVGIGLAERAGTRGARGPVGMGSTVEGGLALAKRRGQVVVEGGDVVVNEGQWHGRGRR